MVAVRERDEVLGEDRQEPRREWHGPAAGGALGERLERGVPLTSTTVRIIRRCRGSRSRASRHRPAASPQRRPVPAVVATRARYRSGTTGTSRPRRSSRLMTWSSWSRLRRFGSRTFSHGLTAMIRFRTASRSTAAVTRWHSATMAGERRAPRPVTHSCTVRWSIFASGQAGRLLLRAEGLGPQPARRLAPVRAIGPGGGLGDVRHGQAPFGRSLSQEWKRSRGTIQLVLVRSCRTNAARSARWSSR